MKTDGWISWLLPISIGVEQCSAMGKKEPDADRTKHESNMAWPASVHCTAALT
jgi:hypothetical protein